MMHTVLLHITNEDPVLGEVEALPSPSDMLVIVKNPRRRDGKDLPYLEANVSTAIWPVTRINFIELIPSLEEDEIISFVRE
ncbi:MAG: hypothetical protein GX491_21400 [Chloroflexi bacterium]|nr:hypothetical protein [Chloroflexota bacterium]